MNNPIKDLSLIVVFAAWFLGCGTNPSQYPTMATAPSEGPIQSASEFTRGCDWTRSEQDYSRPMVLKMGAHGTTYAIEIIYLPIHVHCEGSPTQATLRIYDIRGLTDKRPTVIVRDQLVRELLEGASSVLVSTSQFGDMPVDPGYIPPAELELRGQLIHLPENLANKIYALLKAQLQAPSLSALKKTHESL